MTLFLRGRDAMPGSREQKTNKAWEDQYRQMVLTPVDKLITRLAVPTVVSMMISMIYNLADAYFVGKLGTSASASIGVVMSLHTLFQAIGFMHGHGSGSLISRKLGSFDREAAVKYASIGFYGSLLMSLCLALPGLLFLDSLVRVMGSTETMAPYAKEYAFYILLSGPILAASCVLNNILRYEGKAFYAMIGLVSGGILNIIGDPLCIFVLDMGIRGAGLATALSQYISFFILLFMFRSNKTISKISLRTFLRRFSPGEYGFTLKNGLPSLSRQCLNAFSAIAMNLTAAPYGDAAIAAMTIAGRIMMFIGAAMIGIGQGLQPVAAYNYGAGKYSRIRTGFVFTWKLGEVVMGILALLCFFFPADLIRFFRDDPEVIRIGIRALRFQCPAALLQPVSVVANMCFQSMGLAGSALFLSALRSGLCYIPIILVLPRFIGLAGIESAQLVADLLTLAVTLPFLFRFFRRLRGKEDEHHKMDELAGG